MTSMDCELAPLGAEMRHKMLGQTNPLHYMI